MFSSHLPPVHHIPREYLFAGAGLVLVIAMLFGVAAVASGQVEKAELRHSMLVSQRVAIAQCVETFGGIELNKCVIQAQAAPADSGRTVTTLADNSGGFTRNHAMSAGASQGLIPVAFSTHR